MVGAYTEEVAKTKWCPFARAVANEAGINRTWNGDSDNAAFCLASKCMAWRWRSVKNPDWVWLSPGEEHFPRHPADHPSPWISSETEGYCGLSARG